MPIVHVACKVPAGLNLGDVVLNGTSRIAEQRAEWQRANGGRAPPPALAFPGGYALTEVDADVWTRWWNAHQDSDLVRKGLVFGHADRAVVVQKARAMVGTAGAIAPSFAMAPSRPNPFQG
jgi:hypothetical protein